MPFDGVELGFDERMYKMDKVIDLLAAPERWCKRKFRTYIVCKPIGQMCSVIFPSSDRLPSVSFVVVKDKASVSVALTGVPEPLGLFF